MLSISPLDRLLNQATQEDEITVRIGCSTAKGTPINDNDESYVYIDDRHGYGLDMKHQDFTFVLDDVNKVTCADPSRRKGGSKYECPIDDALQSLTCAPESAVTIELFNRAGASSPENYESIGFYKIPYSM